MGYIVEFDTETLPDVDGRCVKLDPQGCGEDAADVTTTFYRGSNEDSTLLDEEQYVIVKRNSDNEIIDVFPTRKRKIADVKMPVYKNQKTGAVVAVTGTLTHTVDPTLKAYLDGRK